MNKNIHGMIILHSLCVLLLTASCGNGKKCCTSNPPSRANAAEIQVVSYGGIVGEDPPPGSGFNSLTGEYTDSCFHEEAATLSRTQLNYASVPNPQIVASHNELLSYLGIEEPSLQSFHIAHVQERSSPRLALAQDVTFSQDTVVVATSSRFEHASVGGSVKPLIEDLWESDVPAFCDDHDAFISRCGDSYVTKSTVGHAINMVYEFSVNANGYDNIYQLAQQARGVANRFSYPLAPPTGDDLEFIAKHPVAIRCVTVGGDPTACDDLVMADIGDRISDFMNRSAIDGQLFFKLGSYRSALYGQETECTDVLDARDDRVDMIEAWIALESLCTQAKHIDDEYVASALDTIHEAIEGCLGLGDDTLCQTPSTNVLQLCK